MQYCEHCGSEVPLRSHFCGNCGQLLGAGTRGVADITRPSQPDLPAQGTPSLFRTPFPLPIDYAGLEQSNAKETIKHDWSELDQGNQQTQQSQQLQQSDERHTDENRTVFPDVILPFTPLGYGQFPAANAPAVQGTPHIGGVPSVPGTPSAGMPPASPGAPPLQGGSVPHAAPSMPHAAPSVPQHTWTWEQPQHHVQHAQPTPQHQHPQVHHQPHHPAPGGPLKHDRDHDQQHHQPQGHPQHHGHQQPVKVQHTHGIRFPHVPKAGAATTKLAVGAATKWGIVALTAVVVLAASGVILVLANAPGLSLSGSSTVSLGGSLHIHGKGFVPGGSVALTLDNGLPVTATGPQARSVASVGASSGAADASQLLITTDQAENLAPSNNTVTVGISGNFDADVTVPPTWSPGQHVIHATEGLGSRSATLSFTIMAIPAHVTVTPATLDFGTIAMGGKVVKSVLIGNSGGSQLTWNATTDGSTWLKLTNSAGVVEPNGAQEPLYVSVDTTSLKIGAYSASITVHARGGNTQVPVQVHVGPAPKVKQAQLNVNPTTLDFGKLSAGQQVFDNITIGNQGTLALKWQASTGGASWLTLSPTSGNVAVGGIPQTVQVVADTSSSSLQAGPNTAMITIKSNGGITTIPVTLTLNSSQGSPTPTVTPTIPPPILSGSPGGFSAPGDANCSYKAASGWTCTATLNSPANAQSNLSWTATSSGINGVSFSPSSGTLPPGQATKVAISIPNTVCPASATFMFTGPANTLPIAWSCAALALNVSPTTINASTDCQFNNGWTCSVTLSTGSSDEGQLNWTASSSGISGIAFNPPSGTLTAGKPATVSITLPNTTCPASANLNFSAHGGNTATVSWNCSPPQISVSPTTLDQTSSGCTQNTDGTYNCTVTVSETSSGVLNWTASSSNGGSINPPGGQLTPSQSSQTVTLVSIPCQSDSFTFSGQGSNSGTVSWSCNPPQITVTPGSIDPTSSGCTQNSDGTYNCVVTVGETSPGNLNWFAPTGIGGTSISFTPSSGQLSVSQPQQPVTIASIPCGSYSFTFTDQNNHTAMVTWSCTPQIGVSPTSLNQTSTGCTQNTDGTYTCTVTVSETPTGTLSWSASSGVGGSINPSSGQLTPGQPSQTVTLTSINCQNGNITFSGQGSNTVQVSWSCTPPTITVTLSGNCPGDGKGNSVCTDTLQETGGPGTVNWTATAESDLPGTNLPQNGSLSTGQSTQVMVVIPSADCPAGGGTAGHYDYSWTGGNNYRVTFTCPASISTKQVLSSSFVPPFVALASIAGLAVIGRRTRSRKRNGAA